MDRGISGKAVATPKTLEPLSVLYAIISDFSICFYVYADSF